MLYLNTSHITRVGVEWQQLTAIIRQCAQAMQHNDFAQPVKPYLRFGDSANRIIAMPAYVGGDVAMAGIKWIASFPRNIDTGTDRAHSVTILNDSQTGKPCCLIDSTLVSGIRTAAVSGVVIGEYLRRRTNLNRMNVGIIGWGPIGRLHFEAVNALAGGMIDAVYLYDIKPVDAEKFTGAMKSKVRVQRSWQEVYEKADILITCTVSARPYIDLPPKRGSLQLNVSLRDYHAGIRNHVDFMIVDDWNEVCRENTDVQNMHLQEGLQKEDTISLVDLLGNNRLENLKNDDVVMFNPMGMAVFDIGVGNYYYQKAMQEHVGIVLE